MTYGRATDGVKPRGRRARRGAATLFARADRVDAVGERGNARRGNEAIVGYSFINVDNFRNLFVCFVELAQEEVILIAAAVVVGS